MSKIIKIIILVIIGIVIFSYISFNFAKREMLKGAQKTTIESIIRLEMSKIPTVAEDIYSEQKSYEDTNCEHQSMRFICDEIKKLTGNEPITHTSKEKFCTYAKLLSQSEYLCVEYARTPFVRNIHYVIIDPSGTGYCDGKTFVCPPEE